METQSSRAPAKRKRMRFRWGVFFAGLLALFPILIALLVLVPPADLLTAALQKKVREATGRKLIVSSSQYAIRQNISVELNGVALTTPVGQAGPELFSAKSVHATLPLRSLLEGKPQISGLVLDAPVITLQKDEKGQGNWSLSTGDGSGIGLPPSAVIRNGTLSYEDKTSETAIELDAIDATLLRDDKGGGTANASAAFKGEPVTFDVALADFNAVIDGKPSKIELSIAAKPVEAKLAGLVAPNESRPFTGEFEVVSPSAPDLVKWLGYEGSLPDGFGSTAFKGTSDPSGTATASGSVTYRSEPVAFDLSLADAAAALAGKSSGIGLKLGGRHIKGDLTGVAVLGGERSLSSVLDVKSPSVRDLAVWLGFGDTLPPALGPTTIKGKTVLSPSAIELDGADVNFSEISTKWNARLDFGGMRPKLSGKVHASKVDVGQLLSGAGPAAGLQPVEAAPDSEIKIPPAWDDLAAALDRLEGGTRGSLAPESNAPETLSPGSQSLEASTAGSAWSDDPFDIAVLDTVDLDMTVTADEVTYGRLAMKQAQLATKLDDGKLVMMLDRLDVAPGHAQGIFNIDGKANPPAADFALSLDGVAAEPIVRELSGRPWLTGKSSLEIAAKGKGKSQRQLISSLDGKAKIRIGEGALKGFDLKSVILGWWKTWTYDPSRQTTFQKLEGDYNIKKGVLRSTRDLSMQGSVLDINAKGDVIVPSKRLAQDMRLKLIPPPVHLPIPLKVSGPWSKPSVAWDWSGMLENTATFGRPDSLTSSPEPMPAALAERIRRLTSEGVALNQLNASSVDALRSLLPEANQSAPEAELGTP